MNMEQEPLEVRMKNTMLLLKELNCLRDEGMLAFDSIAMDILLLEDNHKSILNQHNKAIIEMTRSKDEEEQDLSKEPSKINEEKIKKLRDDFNLRSGALVSRTRSRVTELKNDIARRRHYFDSLGDGVGNMQRLLTSLSEIASREKIRTDDVISKLPEYATLIKLKRDFESNVNAAKRFIKDQIEKNPGDVLQEEAKDYVANETALSNINKI